jgi:hypothetical protein
MHCRTAVLEFIDEWRQADEGYRRYYPISAQIYGLVFLRHSGANDPTAVASVSACLEANAPMRQAETKIV